MVVIGEDVSEQLDIVPMQIRVLRHIRKRYGCLGSVHVFAEKIAENLEKYVIDLVTAFAVLLTIFR